MEPQRLAVVINQVRRGVFAATLVEQIRGPLLRYVGVEPIAYVPYDRGVLDAALMAGQALREARPGSPAQTTLAQLTATALSTLGLPRQPSWPAPPTSPHWAGPRRGRTGLAAPSRPPSRSSKVRCGNWSAAAAWILATATSSASVGPSNRSPATMTS